MPDYRFLVRLQGLSNLSEDVFENVLYFDTEDVEGVCDGLNSAYAGLTLTGGWNGLEVRVYELAGGQPIFQKEYATASYSSQAAPHEVAICLSYASVDDPEASTPRRRGRIYLGPLGLPQVSPNRPNADLIDDVLDFGEALASIGTGLGTTWKMYSQRDQSTHKIESIWCDDSYDTQRRRGVAPTTRVVRDVQ